MRLRQPHIAFVPIGRACTERGYSRTMEDTKAYRDMITCWVDSLKFNFAAQCSLLVLSSLHDRPDRWPNVKRNNIYRNLPGVGPSGDQWGWGPVPRPTIALRLAEARHYPKLQETFPVVWQLEVHWLIWLAALWLETFPLHLVSRGAEGMRCESSMMTIVWFLRRRGKKRVTAFKLACVVLVVNLASFTPCYTCFTKSLCFLFSSFICLVFPARVHFSFYFFLWRWLSHGILVSSRRTGSSQQSMDCVGQGAFAQPFYIVPAIILYM